MTAKASTRYHRLPDGTRLAYTELGAGQPVILLHGVLGSRRFYERNIDALAEHFHVFAVDLRGHGDSDDSQGGNTVAQYARDVDHFLAARDLSEVVGVGWSMGNFVIWDYLQQFGSASRIAAQVCISQGPSDLNANGWEHGFTDHHGLRDLIAMTQDDYAGMCAYLATVFTQQLPSAEDQAWMVEEQLKVLPNTAGCILTDQTQRDYREVIPSLPVPMLAVWGSDEKCLPVAAGAWVATHAPRVTFVVLERSGHMPMWEEPELFNPMTVDWIRSLAL
ncbi:alpha/beta fold hydrolase [Nocardioides sp. GXZ039]|uniref:alpha/beta fold hydrolase n=1 Tax=Nocardioides sp. GXZ039 TaxID=3136018 RepID=UPI0030F377C5